MRILRAATFVVISSFLILACESDEGGTSGSAKAPFAPNEATVERTYDYVDVNGSAVSMKMQQIGTKTIAGMDWPRYRAGKPDSDNTDGPEIWMTFDEDEVVAAGGEIYWEGSGLAPAGMPMAVGNFDPPLVIDLGAPVGEAQVVHVTGDAVIGDPDSPLLDMVVDHDVTYTVVAADVAIDSPMGPISGCTRVEASVEVEGQPYSGEVVMHPTMGIVGAWVSWPPPSGVTLDIRDIHDFGSASAGSNEIQGVALVGPGNPHFALDTYDVNGDLDADKNTHAKMFLEMRFADEAMAMTETQPAVTVEFGTTWGYYEHVLVPSPISFFHPEENGKGYTFWVAYVDQAAKNQEVNGISYHITVDNPDYNTQDVRVTGRLIYKRYTP